MTTTAQSARNPLVRLPAEEFGHREARHLLLRAGFGGTDQQIETMLEWGLDRAVDHLVDYESIPTEPDARDLFDHNIMRPLSRQERAQLQAARQRGDEDTLARFRRQRQQSQRDDRRQMADIRRWWLSRMISTPRPLEEKLTLLWHGHFTTSYRTVEDSYHLFMQNRLFRGNAKSFPHLLRGIIRDPAMLRYLNNDQNRRANPNENLARELLELFTLGEGNYSERDIREGARALTGYTFEDDAFVFNHNQHDKSTKAIFRRMANFDGDGFITAILGQNACAPFVANRLYRFLVADGPAHPRELTGDRLALVRAMSERVRRDRYELSGTLKAVFLSRYFYSDAVVGRKIKSPAELVVGAVRTLGVPARDINALLASMDRMGQNLFYPPSVKGWDGGRAWINTATLFARQNTLTYLITGRQPTGRDRRADDDYDPRTVLALASKPGEHPRPEEIAAAMLRLALGQTDQDKARIIADSLSRLPNPADRAALAGAMALITALPEYQLC
ncbi:MAG: DUF1800 domain-containing protein [Phycisphaerales bacterium]|nr:DUF1800 domain-containing protein [Planctomycetota bacterium]MCH8507484.1 DUF1800 domain-containing protein [Phycisphaerales bacterium]